MFSTETVFTMHTLETEADLALSPGEVHDVRLAGKLLSRLKSGSMLLADRGYTPTGSENLQLRMDLFLTV